MRVPGRHIARFFPLCLSRFPPIRRVGVRAAHFWPRTGWVMNERIGWSKGWVLLTLLAMAGCRDDKDPAPAPAGPAATFTVGGSVSGLSGSVTLANNGGDGRTVAAN